MSKRSHATIRRRISAEMSFSFFLIIALSRSKLEEETIGNLFLFSSALTRWGFCFSRNFALFPPAHYSLSKNAKCISFICLLRSSRSTSFAYKTVYDRLNGRKYKENRDDVFKSVASGAGGSDCMTLTRMWTNSTRIMWSNRSSCRAGMNKFPSRPSRSMREAIALFGRIWICV